MTKSIMLATAIHESRRKIGWDVPWFVAQVSDHVPGDETSPDIRAAQLIFRAITVPSKAPTAMR